MNLDDKLRQARDSVRTELDDVVPPEFSPRPRTGRAVGALALVGLLLVGGFLATRDNNDQPAPVATSTGDEVGQPADGQIGIALADEAIAPVFSGTQAFNADGTLVVLYRTGEGGGRHILFDAATGTEVAVPDDALGNIEPVDVEDVYWDSSNPSLLRYVQAESNQFMALDVRAGTITVEHTFESCETVDSGDTSGSINSGSSLYGFLCHKANGESTLVSFDTSTITEVESATAAPSNNTDGPVTLASGKGFVVVGADTVEVLDTNFEPMGAESVPVELARFAATTDATGADILVATIFSDAEDLVGSAVVVDLSTGQRRVVVGPEAGDPYPPAGTRLSVAAADRPGVLVLTSFPDPADDNELANQILVIDLGQTEPTVTNLGSHSMTPTDQFGTWGDPMVAISPDGSTVLYSSNFGGDSVNTYSVAVD